MKTARKIALLTLCVFIGCVMAGCETLNTAQLTAVDTFCLTSKKRLWSINDSPESIREAEIWNGTIDRRCGVKKRTA